MSRVAVVGGSGFVGRAVVEAAQARGADVVSVPAPRLTSEASTVAELHRDLERPEVRDAVEALRGRLAGCTAVVNAAGMSAATTSVSPELAGANSLLPLVVAAARPTGSRLVHVSTAAVQGNRPVLDETDARAPFSPYSTTKALAEECLASEDAVVVFRPTSVHGPGRDVTRSLARVLASPLASVAGAGDGPTPQALVPNVADAITFVTLHEDVPPAIVLHPWEGLTVAELVRRLGGREPRHVPVRLATAAVRAASRLGRHSARMAGESRRLEMMWFGQRQVDGWLRSRWEAPAGLDGWKELR
ncbi:NAD-dependent epimerase/dehydratase family protein [Nocardia sp. N13]|uniref:NAD-dependent epimerase/dehydratase family protein n=1 Tax=Nocardioides sp. N13(2025) TaxID=3453405 RepID=UPI003F773117